MTSSLIDPRLLSAQQRKAIALLATGQRCVRRAGGWGHAPYAVSLDVAGSLSALHLVRVDRSGQHPRLVLTGTGLNVNAVMQARQERRKA